MTSLFSWPLGALVTFELPPHSWRAFSLSRLSVTGTFLWHPSFHAQIGKYLVFICFLSCRLISLSKKKTTLGLKIVVSFIETRNLQIWPCKSRKEVNHKLLITITKYASVHKMSCLSHPHHWQHFLVKKLCILTQFCSCYLILNLIFYKRQRVYFGVRRCKKSEFTESQLESCNKCTIFLQARRNQSTLCQSSVLTLSLL